MALETLKRRSQFLRVRGGRRFATTAFVLEGRARPPTEATPHSASMPKTHTRPRFGFTVTKRLGGAVDRNRIRRRLRAALELTSPTCADPHFDYVIVARRAALSLPFETLTADLVAAFRHIHRRPTQSPVGPRRAT